MKRMEPLSRQELLKLLAAARQESTRDWCMLLLMYCHGLRASEVGQLKRSDLNERDWTLSISRLKGSEKTLQVIYPNSKKLLNAKEAITIKAFTRSKRNPHSPAGAARTRGVRKIIHRRFCANPSFRIAAPQLLSCIHAVV